MQGRRQTDLFLIWLMHISALSLLIAACTAGELSETEALINFIRAVDPRNVMETNWNMSMTHPCLDQWMGVKCDSQTHTITEIRLENLNLSGIIDADSLCKLPFIRVLDLANNNIQGGIPDSMSNCTSLTFLNLSHNLLQGRVPDSLTKLTNLQFLDISKNNFSGTIPNFRQEFKHAKYAASRTMQTFGVTPNMIIPAEQQSAAVSNTTERPKHQGRVFARWWFLLIAAFAVGFFLFLYFMVKKYANSCKKKEILWPLDKHSIKTPAQKNGEEMKPQEEEELVFFVEEKKFKIEDLLESSADLKGQSLFSSLYKVVLKNNMTFAVKRLKKLQVSDEEFNRTMRHIGKMKHPNILPLVAYQSSGEEKLLIYNYQTNGSLLTLLENYTEGKRDFPWRIRLSIARGIARGLEFMHRKRSDQESVPHGNIKLSNILLSETEEPLISEYGFQRFIDPKKTILYSSNGYQAPEKKLTEESDVFSFGIILLELLTGKTVEGSGLDLPKWVKSMVREEWTGEVFDKEVNKKGKGGAFPLLVISLNCVSHSPKSRPRIGEVLDKIEEVVNVVEDYTFSSTSSLDSHNQKDCCLLHTIINDAWETPGSNH